MGSREYTEEQSLVGLTEAEVQERIAAGQTNRADITTEKTTKQIILSNTLTYFNLIFLVLAILLTEYFFYCTSPNTNYQIFIFEILGISVCCHCGHRHCTGAAGKENTG